MKIEASSNNFTEKAKKTFRNSWPWIAGLYFLALLHELLYLAGQNIEWYEGPLITVLATLVWCAFIFAEEHDKYL